MVLSLGHPHQKRGGHQLLSSALVFRQSVVTWTPKKMLAINYNFVIMAGFYEKDVLLFCNWAVVDPADWMRSSDFFCKSLRFSTSNNRAGRRRHR
jgi:hypothetical protein